MRSLLSACINLWIGLTGRKVQLADTQWLDGPVSDKGLIGSDFYRQYAAQEQLQATQSDGNGLLTHFKSVIPDSDPHKHLLMPEISHFYEHTSSYKLEVWSEWYRPVKFFAHTLIRMLSSQMDQLNIPLKPLETSRGMSNEVISLQQDGQQVLACWLRKSVLTNKVVYAGFYSAVKIGATPYVRVVFPLPKGNATVLLRVEAQADGSVKLLSDGRKEGGAGYYRIKKTGDNTIRYKYVPIKESIHVYLDNEQVLRTDHVFWFLKMKLLHLHYKMEPVKR